VRGVDFLGQISSGSNGEWRRVGSRLLGTPATENRMLGGFVARAHYLASPGTGRLRPVHDKSKFLLENYLSTMK
jgi:hypothetical protein